MDGRIRIATKPAVHARLEHAIVKARETIVVRSHVLGKVPNIERRAGCRPARTGGSEDHRSRGGTAIVAIWLALPWHIMELPAVQGRAARPRAALTLAMQTVMLVIRRPTYTV